MDKDAAQTMHRIAAFIRGIEHALFPSASERDLLVSARRFHTDGSTGAGGYRLYLEV
jgi:hypothetical protein